LFNAICSSHPVGEQYDRRLRTLENAINLLVARQGPMLSQPIADSLSPQRNTSVANDHPSTSQDPDEGSDDPIDGMGTMKFTDESHTGYFGMHE